MFSKDMMTSEVFRILHGDTWSRISSVIEVQAQRMKMMMRTKMMRMTKIKRTKRHQRRYIQFFFFWSICYYVFIHYPPVIMSIKVFYFILKAGPIKKRPAESIAKTPLPDKKAKFVTPKKNGELPGVCTFVTQLFMTRIIKRPLLLVGGEFSKQLP